MGTVKNDHLHDSYKAIISKFCSSNIPESDFKRLKEDFKMEIDSVRVYDMISNMEELLQVLERRNVIGVFKIYKLFDVAKNINNNKQIAIGSLLNYHAKLLAKRTGEPSPCVSNLNLLTDFVPTLPESEDIPTSTLYVSSLPETNRKDINSLEKSPSELSIHDVATIFSPLLSLLASPTPDTDYTSVVDLISSSITVNWKEFTRSLQIISESDIDFIDKKFDALEDKTRQVLQRYPYEAQLQRLRCPYLNVLSALERVKRRDLKEQVEELLDKM